jgi:hypothetical protein
MFIGLLFCSILSFAQEDLMKLAPLKARGFFVSSELKPGMLADLQVEMTLQEGFFAYHDRFRLKVTDPENMQVGENRNFSHCGLHRQYRKKEKKEEGR